MRFFATTAAIAAAGLLGLTLATTSLAQEQQGQTVSGQLVFLHSFITGQPLVEGTQAGQEGQAGPRAKLMGPPVMAIHTAEDQLVIVNLAKLRHQAQARRQQERQELGVTPEEQWEQAKAQAKRFINKQVKAEGTLYQKAGIHYLIVESIQPTEAQARAK